MKLAFEWDETKAGENLKKHKVGFDEGKTTLSCLHSQTLTPPMQRSVMSISVYLLEIGFWF